MSENNKALTKALEWVVEIDPPAIIASVKAEREKYPDLSNQKLAERHSLPLDGKLLQQDL
ncbi:hypothetical protein EC567_24685 [Vibrio parahaemolyticus]|uniref:hypothetical protein n=1 Tax=Vibrio parahaemolyticus TaxID=670 RepID=UPI001EF7C677|nr:hypothetical protein [Vibrio parahaemolyticus]EGR1156087.1 hypothetical protein [Vibrio parahaemolyticus]MCG7824295.1 hypothetical protein [Vibrio parahaemolyticus]